jgi:thiol-disulfide isomerase/thioredoxin
MHSNWLLIALVATIIVMVMMYAWPHISRACAGGGREDREDRGGRGVSGRISGSKEMLTCKSDAHLAEVLENSPEVLVIFWATWCPHCKTTLPEFENASKDTDVVFLSVEQQSVSNDTLMGHGVEGFPSIVKFLDGKKAGQYAGNRKAADILEWASRK